MRLLFWRRGDSDKRRASDVAADSLSQQISTMADEIVSKQEASARGIVNLTKTLENMTKIMERDGARFHNGRG